MRRQARELGLQLLYQFDFGTEVSLQQTSLITEQFSGAKYESESQEYAQKLFAGVRSKKSEIDSLIQNASRHWKIDRMASVDRNLLRLAVFEIFFSTPNIEPKIVINEFIEIAKKFGSQESSAFVNGILDQIVKDNSDQLK